MDKKSTEFIEFTLQFEKLRQQCAKLELWATYQLLHDVIRKAGLERAEQLNKELKQRII